MSADTRFFTLKETIYKNSSNCNYQDHDYGKNKTEAGFSIDYTVAQGTELLSLYLISTELAQMK